AHESPDLRHMASATAASGLSQETSMKTSRLIWPSVALAALTWALLRGHDSPAQLADSSLPGAQRTIEAIRYPSLQAALDALPPDGGVVRLPAGTFEITQPLLLTQEDVSWRAPARRRTSRISTEVASPPSSSSPHGWQRIATPCNGASC